MSYRSKYDAINNTQNRCEECYKKYRREQVKKAKERYRKKH